MARPVRTTMARLSACSSSSTQTCTSSKQAQSVPPWHQPLKLYSTICAMAKQIKERAGGGLFGGRGQRGEWGVLP